MVSIQRITLDSSWQIYSTMFSMSFVRYRGNFLAKDFHVFSVKLEHDAEKKFEETGNEQANIVQRVLPEHINFQREQAYVGEPTEFEYLL